MSEWSKVSVLKTDVLQNTGGSNPSPSVRSWRRIGTEAGWRGFYALLAWITATCVAYGRGDVLLAIYLNDLPALSQNVLFLQPMEALQTYLRLAVHFGLLFSLPLWMYSGLCFLRPGLYLGEARKSSGLQRQSLLAWCISFFLSWKVLWPLVGNLALHFQSATESLQFQPRLASLGAWCIGLHWVSLVFCLSWMAVYQYVHWYPQTPMTRYRGLVWWCVLLLSALVCPPEVSLQVFLSLLVGLCFEGLAWYGCWLRRKQDYLQRKACQLKAMG